MERANYRIREICPVCLCFADKVFHLNLVTCIHLFVTVLALVQLSLSCTFSKMRTNNNMPQ